jgi:hypothetical protein
MEEKRQQAAPSRLRMKRTPKNRDGRARWALCRLGSNPTFCLCFFFRTSIPNLVQGITRSLLFVAVQAVDGSDGAEKAVRFALNSRGEKQFSCWAGPFGRIRRVAAKSDHPKAVNNHD